jgi:anaerobic selenocysteine-containing dehydrogenase
LACHATDPKAWYERLLKLEFIAGADLWMTPTLSALADVVLPVACFPEKDSFRACLYNLSTTNKAIEPAGEARSDNQLVIDLGKRFSREMFPWDTDEQELDELLKPAGISFKELKQCNWVYPEVEYKKYEKGQLRPDGQFGFMTPTGKIELYASIMEAVGVSPVPYFEEPLKSPVSTPELFEKYPLILMTGVRSPGYFHSEGRNIPFLRELQPDPIVEIHPDYASAHGISDGDWVWIENDKDRIRQKAKVTPIVHPQMALANHGWWFSDEDGTAPHLFGCFEHNVSRLLDMGVMGPTGFGADLKCTLCKIYKVTDGES